MSAAPADRQKGLAQPSARKATVEDRTQVVATVAAAFAGDPGWAFLLGEEYERLAPRFAGALFDLRIASGGIWVVEDCAAVAMWDVPSRSASAERAQAIWEEYRRLAGEEAHERLVLYNRAVSAAASAGPHWYLGVLATSPAHRRTGLATRVLFPVLERADQEGLACCLETSTESNRRFYEARGFTEATGVTLPGAPPTWWLRRPPSRSSG